MRVIRATGEGRTPEKIRESKPEGVGWWEIRRRENAKVGAKEEEGGGGGRQATREAGRDTHMHTHTLTHEYRP